MAQVLAHLQSERRNQFTVKSQKVTWINGMEGLFFLPPHSSRPQLSSFIGNPPKEEKRTLGRLTLSGSTHDLTTRTVYFKQTTSIIYYVSSYVLKKKSTI